MTYAQETLRLARDEDDVVLVMKVCRKRALSHPCKRALCSLKRDLLMSLVMKAARLLAALYKGRGQEIEAHQARGTGSWATMLTDRS